MNIENVTQYVKQGAMIFVCGVSLWVGWQFHSLSEDLHVFELLMSDTLHQVERIDKSSSEHLRLSTEASRSIQERLDRIEADIGLMRERLERAGIN